MNTSDQINELAAALAKAQAEMKNATLNKVNPHFKSKYADLAAIRDAIVPVLAKHGLSLVQGTIIRDPFLVLTTRLMHSSGQWVQNEYPITNSGKPQAMGSELTYARRYMLAAIGVIASEEDDDGNAAQSHNNGNGRDAGLQGDTQRPADSDFADVDGNPGISISKVARDFYSQCSAEIRTHKTAPGLKTWGETRKPEIRLKLPPGYVGHLEQEYLEQMHDIKSGKFA